MEIKKTIKVTLRDYEGNCKKPQDVDCNKPLKELAGNLAFYLEISKEGVYVYKIMHNGKWLKEDTTLMKEGVKDGDELIIHPIVLAYIICLENLRLNLCIANLPGGVPIKELKPIIIEKMGIYETGINIQEYRLVNINEQFVNRVRKGAIWLDDKDTLLKTGTIEGGIVFLLLLYGKKIDTEDFSLKEVI